MKKAVIVTPFDNYSYSVRIKYLEKYLNKMGYECTVLSADFDHRNKCHYETKRNNLELIHVPEYKRNLSFSRIYSHYIFAKRVYKRLIEANPDFVYGSAPPNFLFKYLGKYKKKHKHVNLIFEIGDMWPETLPLNDKVKKVLFLPLGIWASIRNQNLKSADYIIYECDLFKNILQKYHPKVKSETIYLAKEDFYNEKMPIISSSDILNIAYVGSINNIVDIEGIIKILKALKRNRRVLFHIIGDGESKERLLHYCSNNRIEYHDYGIVYDDFLKQKILEQCQFGLNIMKSTVMVGATMKSLEYLHWGLIMINNIPADTEQIVMKYRCGFNIKSFDEEEIEKLAKTISSMSEQELDNMRMQSRNAYLNLFDEKKIHKQYKMLLNNMER